MIELQTKEMTLKVGEKLLCNQLNLTIKSGEIWGILGANGSGKTTFLHTFAGLHTPNKGEIWLNKSDISQINLKNLSQKNLARLIGILLQHFNTPFPQSVWEYCQAGRYPHFTYFKKETPNDFEIVKQALQVMDLFSLKQRCVTKLSGGEKRRLALACLLAQTPLLYLLDEPTNHLDIRHQIQVLNYFRHLSLNQSAAVIMAMHDINLAQQFCTHLLLLFPGGSTSAGKTDELLTASNLFQLYGQKFRAVYNGVYWQPESDINN